MHTILSLPAQTPVFVLEIIGSKSQQEYLESIGIKPESLITITKNPALECSTQPVIIEIHEARFMLDQDLAKDIIVAHALDDQNKIFHGNKTQQRSALLEILKSHSGHFTLPRLTELVQQKFPEMGEITIYRNLKTLIEKEIVEEIDLPGDRKTYEVKKGHHEHIFCQNCGALIEFYDEEMEAVQERIMREHGATLLSHRVTLIASSCANCKK